MSGEGGEISLRDRTVLALAPEAMDGPLPYPEAERALDDLDRVNRLLLGLSAARRALVPRLTAAPGAPVRLLDLGSGCGRLARAVARSAARRGAPVRLVLVDRRLTHLAVGRRRGRASADPADDPPPLAVAASADALPFRSGAVDWSFSNLFFHHLGGRENRAVVAEMLRCARSGAVIVDLRRSRLARGLVRLLFPLLRIGRVARHDGLLSLAQSWTVPEVRDLLSDLPVLELRRRFPFRWSLVVAAPGAASARGGEVARGG